MKIEFYSAWYFDVQRMFGRTEWSCTIKFYEHFQLLSNQKKYEKERTRASEGMFLMVTVYTPLDSSTWSGSFLVSSVISCCLMTSLNISLEDQRYGWRNSTAAHRLSAAIPQTTSRDAWSSIGSSPLGLPGWQPSELRGRGWSLIASLRLVFAKVHGSILLLKTIPDSVLQ